jgi:hypothetical protein
MNVCGSNWSVLSLLWRLLNSVFIIVFIIINVYTQKSIFNLFSFLPSKLQIYMWVKYVDNKEKENAFNTKCDSGSATA